MNENLSSILVLTLTLNGTLDNHVVGEETNFSSDDESHDKNRVNLVGLHTSFQ